MLVYVRESDISQIICEATENDIAEHLRARLKKEKEEKDRKKKEKAEAHLYTQVKLATRQDMANQVGQDIYFDLVDHGYAAELSSETDAVRGLQEAGSCGARRALERQRYWAWARRQNQTFRPNNALTHDDAGDARRKVAESAYAVQGRDIQRSQASARGCLSRSSP